MAGGQKGKVGGAIIHGANVGGKRSKEFRSWLSMRQRCKQKPHYLKNGTVVCPECQSSFAAFLRDVGRAPSESHTLDRWPNAAGNYEPGNVRWATMLEQRHHRRADAKVSRPWLGRRRSLPHGPDGRFAKKQSPSDYAEVR
jgi:hypothetical protein